MDKRDKFVADYEKSFYLMRNATEIEKKLEKVGEILNEFDKNGITSIFLSRKNGNIFRENAITSQETQELSKKAKKAYVDIKKAVLYDISNPIEAEKWLNTLVPYLNNCDLDLDYFVHFGIPDLENPLSDIMEELENKGYNELRASVVTEDDKEHNQVVNAYNLIKSFSFKTSKKQLIDKQLEIIKNYVSDQETITLIQNIKDYQKVEEKLAEYNTMLINQGATNTILNILKENGFDKQAEEQEIRNIENPEEVLAYGMTEEELDHNYIFAMYKQIENYGFLIEPLKEQLDKEEILLDKVMEMDEIQDYKNKMEARTNVSTFKGDELAEEDVNEITVPSKIALPAFLERVVNKILKREEKEEILTGDEKVIKQKLEDLPTMNYDVFAYQLRDFKNYINDYNKPLNLSDGTNIIEEILNRAQALELTTKDVNQIIKENPKCNPVLIHYAKKQITDLIDYGCFLTSYCNDVIKKNGINLDSFEQEKTEVSEEKTSEYELQLPAIKIDTKEFLEKVIQANMNTENSDKKILKKVIDPAKDASTITEKTTNEPEENPRQKEDDNKIKNMSTTLILDDLVKKNNEILDKNGIEKGIRIVEIQDELEKLTTELQTVEDSKNSTLDNGLTLIETISKSDVRKNENYDEYMKNIKEQRKKEYEIKRGEYYQLQEEYESSAKSTEQEFIDNFRMRRKERDKIRENDPIDEVALAREKECAITYQKIRSLYEKHQEIINMRYTDIKIDDATELSGEKFESNLEKLQQLTTETKTLLDGIDKIENYSQEEIDNFNKMYELMTLGNKIYTSYNESMKLYMEILQLDSMSNDNINKKDSIEQKIKKLELEEEMLSFNPETTRKEIEELMKSAASDEEISAKFDELLKPIIELNAQQELTLVNEISKLEEKLANKENYVDDNKIELETRKRDNLNEIISEADEKIDALRKIQSDKDLQTRLENWKEILLAQQNGYEEEKEILLQWSVEESESDLDTRKALDELFAESKENLNDIALEIKDCEEKIESLEKTNLTNDEIEQEIARLEDEKRSLLDKVNNINQSLTNNGYSKFLNKELILSDTEELNRKKQELEEIRNDNLEKRKEEFLLAYSDEKQLAQQSTALPGVVDGKKLNSDWTMEDEELSFEEVEDITDANENLIEKATNLFKKIGKNILDWIKENPKIKTVKNWIQEHKKIAAAVGIAVGITVVGGAVSVIRGLSNDASDIDKIPVEPSTGIETISEDKEAETNTDNIVAAVDKAIEEMDEVKEDIPSFEENYKSANVKVMNEETPLYASADRALNGQEAVGSVYKPSFENADSTKIYKLEDDNLVKISYEEAQNIVENGGQVSVALENDGVGIGYVTLGGNDTVEENSVGMSK